MFFLNVMPETMSLFHLFASTFCVTQRSMKSSNKRTSTTTDDGSFCSAGKRSASKGETHSRKLDTACWNELLQKPLFPLAMDKHTFIIMEMGVVVIVFAFAMQSLLSILPNLLLMLPLLDEKQNLGPSHPQQSVFLLIFLQFEFHVKIHFLCGFIEFLIKMCGFSCPIDF